MSITFFEAGNEKRKTHKLLCSEAMGNRDWNRSNVFLCFLTILWKSLLSYSSTVGIFLQSIISTLLLKKPIFTWSWLESGHLLLSFEYVTIRYPSLFRFSYILHDVLYCISLICSCSLKSEDSKRRRVGKIWTAYPLVSMVTFFL